MKSANIILVIFVSIWMCACETMPQTSTHPSASKRVSRVKATKAIPTQTSTIKRSAIHLSDWREIVINARLGKDENIKVLELERTDEASHHLVQIRDREKLHMHQDHDLTVFILEGDGVMAIGDSARTARTGHVLFIPRTAPHRFINLSDNPAVAYTIFTPPFDGKDIVPIIEPQSNQ
ncbi:MAG: cupin domain-containing protein [Candidatus Lindowbacteria bacterium]|nr:cupin domain-containing protein [Candidatus Lindowbacteria bacterium]